MPNGVPVATVALNASKNAAILAMQILGSSDKVIQQKCIDYKIKLEEEVMNKVKNFKAI